MATVPSTREPVTPAALSIGPITGTDIGLLAIRLIIGIVFIYHGAHKLFPSGALSQFADMLSGMGVPLAFASATVSACVEFFGGLAILLGLATRIVAVPMAINMLVAILLVHSKAFDIRHGGMEYALTLGVVLFGLAFTGPGKLSLSGLLRRSAPLAKLGAQP
ncbi:MAG TPA: DoxX family protein [Phycisphaerae bacterium]|jgi:putative oxidoreductase|nr:DoxX family protein [Phycisphaerae bacterium]HOB74266.1 DoxX family protein [Phycisphaerae bacterium]HOJ53143.1 DoxX family protein [Phycisphaerae bacterium]HOL24880.1 DoxX family protein [Phycisphaerae bacterium]HPP19416.1 DoxX family protein [Phycisphaerae bacterium]